MSRILVSACTDTSICPLIGQICRHFGHEYRFVRKEFSVLKTHTTESAVSQEDLGGFCNSEGLFTGSMLHGCPNVTGYDYLAARAADHSNVRTGRTRMPSLPSASRARVPLPRRRVPVRESQQ